MEGFDGGWGWVKNVGFYYKGWYIRLLINRFVTSLGMIKNPLPLKKNSK